MIRNILITLTIVACSLHSSAETYIVETGGNQSVTPYYLPQFLTINVGDTVIWDFVLGTHNVTTTSGPVSIDSGDIQSPDEFMFVFTIAGVYDYECTLFDHAETQFGTITVEESNGISEEVDQRKLDVYPMPCLDFFYLDVSETIFVEGVELYNASGKRVSVHWDQQTNRASFGNIASGVYVAKIYSSTGIIRKSIVVER